MKSQTILVLYGGVNPEHEVSIISAMQVMHALKEAGYQVIPAYISKKGDWYLGDDAFLKPETYHNLTKLTQKATSIQPLLASNPQLLKKTLLGYRPHQKTIDAVFPVFHGQNGEDGSMQGIIQLLNLPQVGCGVTASALGIDKYLMKRIAHNLDIPVVQDVLITKAQWSQQPDIIKNQLKELGVPIFLKPNRLGSSIGIQKIDSFKKLSDTLEVAFKYDHRVLAEAALTNMTEVNVSILGNDPYQTSVTEQPLSSEEILSFQDKYLGNKPSKSKEKSPQGMAGANRKIPAPISESLTNKIEDYTKDIFTAIDGKGIARLDFMIQDNTIYFNEINTIPGSLSFYLWEASGIPFKKLVTKLVQLAQEDWQERQQKVTTFHSNILKGYSKNASKASKQHTSTDG